MANDDKRVVKSLRMMPGWKERFEKYALKRKWSEATLIEAIFETYFKDKIDRTNESSKD